MIQTLNTVMQLLTGPYFSVGAALAIGNCTMHVFHNL